MPKCEGPQSVDVAVVGGGIVGLCTAFELVKQGRRPVVFERNRIASAITGHTTAKVTSQHGVRYRRLIDIHGQEKARAYADANQSAVEWLFATCEEHGIECGLERDTACVYSEMPEDKEAFEDEEDACYGLGLPVGEPPATPVPVRLENVIAFSGQGRFHPVQFLRALAQIVLDRGGTIYEHSPVTSFEGKDGGVELECNGHSVTAREAVVATHYPVFDSGFFIAKLAPYRSYAMAVELAGPPPSGMFISNESELHSWRPHAGLMIVGAGCHKVGQEPDTKAEYRKLEDRARAKFEVRRVVARWSAQDNATHDELPYVGRSPGQEHIYVATGFDGWGMSNGIAAAGLIANLIQRRDDPLAEALDPGRLSLQGLTKFAKENLNAVGHLTTDRLTKVEDGDPEDLGPGEAGIFSAGGLSRIAAYRDEEGALHRCSAACPHFGCQVAWNPAERTWDCPCHGSRFLPNGDVIQSPALGGLKALVPAKSGKKP
jgi:glycine/D-amino acid oxidase-like deaminating enzyme/nitrite reductase/ring-hydroxylating ferredoxin subunit